MKPFTHASGAFVLLVGMCCSPAVLADTPWRFIVSGDSRGSYNGVNTPILTELAAQFVSQGAEFVLFPGDLVNGGVNQTTMQSQLTTWRNTMAPVYNAGIGVYAIRGNHDLGSPAGTTAWNNVLADLPDNGPAGEVNLTYSVAHKNAFVLGLDESVSAHRVNQTWVNSQLAGNTRPHVFAFGHEPAFKADHADCLDDYPANRDALWISLENAGARTYFAGHDHFYDRARVDGDGNPDNDLYQYVVGTAGAPLYSWSPPYNGLNSGRTVTQAYHATQYGYVIVEINGLLANLTWMERIGANNYAARDAWSYTAIPEPSVLVILALGVVATLGARRRPRG